MYEHSRVYCVSLCKKREIVGNSQRSEMFEIRCVLTDNYLIEFMKERAGSDVVL